MKAIITTFFAYGLVMAVIAVSTWAWDKVHAESAATSVTVSIQCNNQNVSTSPRCTAPVDWFIVNDDGSAFGQLTSGITFSQFNISNELGVRLQKFVIETAYWYITDRGVIHADTDTQALSIYLTKV